MISHLLLFTVSLRSATGMAAIWQQIVPPNAVRLSENNRVIEYPFGEEFLASVDSTTASFLSNQAERDAMNDAYTPQLDDYYSLSEITPFGAIELAELLVAGAESAVFAIKDKPNLVIKYQANCDLQNGVIHPLLLESHSTPDAVPFVSPPALLPFIVPLKLKFFSMHADDWYNCMSRNGVARYAILERMQIPVDVAATKIGSIGPLSLSSEKIVDDLPRIEVSRIY